jgi:RNA polymerase sigma-70 factor, ECF subfamily
MNETPASPSNATTDEMLMRSFSQGSHEAFTELFRRYRQPIYGFFCRRVSDPARAEELAQETFLALLRSGVRYEPRALFRTYLYAIALKILRSDRRKTIFRAAFFGLQNAAPDPAKRDATESDLWIRHAIAKLEPMDREILLLREFEQLNYSEIAELLQLATNTVRSRLFRARMALRELLEPGAATIRNDAPQAMPHCTPQSTAPKGERA